MYATYACFLFPRKRRHVRLDILDTVKCRGTCRKILFRSECFIDYVVQHGIEVYLSLIPFGDQSTLATTRQFNAFFMSVFK